MNKKLGILAIACSITLILGGTNFNFLFGTQHTSIFPGYATTYGSDVDWYDCNWSYCKRIVIDHNKVAGYIQDFTVLLYEASDSDLVAHAQSDGEDIIFVDRLNLTKYNHQIENYNSGRKVSKSRKTSNKSNIKQKSIKKKESVEKRTCKMHALI